MMKVVGGSPCVPLAFDFDNERLCIVIYEYASAGDNEKPELTDSRS
ncbi:MAG TPA: hypothetical protein VGF45_11005 [Polyangia bacterium]